MQINAPSRRILAASLATTMILGASALALQSVSAQETQERSTETRDSGKKMHAGKQDRGGKHWGKHAGGKHGGKYMRNSALFQLDRMERKNAVTEILADLAEVPEAQIAAALDGGRGGMRQVVRIFDIDRDALRAAMADYAESEVAASFEAGRITEPQAAALLAQIEARRAKAESRALVPLEPTQPSAE